MVATRSKAKTIGRFAATIQKWVRSCPIEEPWDGDDVVWVNSQRVAIYDLLLEAEVPEAMWDEVLAKLRCPECGSSFEIGSDAGTAFAFELEYEQRLKSAEARYGSQIRAFAQFLAQYPYLGAKHSLGKRILKSIAGFPKIGLPSGTWYRALKVSGPTVPSDLKAPNPREHAITEGRFNHSGQSHWYLAQSEQAASLETTRAGERAVWVQGWQLAELSDVLDLRAWLADDPDIQDASTRSRSVPLLAMALIFGDHTTEQPSQDTSWKPQYLVPRFVSDAAKEAGFKAIRYRSERHLEDNLIVFEEQGSAKPTGPPRLFMISDEIESMRERLFLHKGLHVLIPLESMCQS